MSFSDSLTQRVNALEEYASHAPPLHLPIKLLAWILLFMFLMLTNLLAVIRWPLVSILERVRPKNAKDWSPKAIASPEDLDGVLKEHEYVLVDFWAQWCGPCMLMNPAIEKVSEDYMGKIRVVKVDASLQMEVCKQYQVKGLPTLILFKSGEELDRRSGAMTVADMTFWLAEKSPSLR